MQLSTDDVKRWITKNIPGAQIDKIGVAQTKRFSDLGKNWVAATWIGLGVLKPSHRLKAEVLRRAWIESSALDGGAVDASALDGGEVKQVDCGDEKNAQPKFGNVAGGGVVDTNVDVGAGGKTGFFSVESWSVHHVLQFLATKHPDIPLNKDAFLVGNIDGGELQCVETWGDVCNLVEPEPVYSNNRNIKYARMKKLSKMLIAAILAVTQPEGANAIDSDGTAKETWEGGVDL